MLVKPGISAIVMGIGAIGGYYGIYSLIPSNTFATIIAIIFAMFVYFVVMVIVKGFKREDLQMIPAGTKLVAVLEKLNRI